MKMAINEMEEDDCNYYTVISFWKWVFEKALPPSNNSENQSIVAVPSRKMLLNMLNLNKEIMRLHRPSTANFVFHSSTLRKRRIVLGDSLVLEGLEDKDVFVSTMSNYAKYKIPQSILIPFDLHLSKQNNNKNKTMLDNVLTLPTVPAVLKQPLGCCGHGVFFVSTVEEILEKVETNYKNAHAEKGFLDMIMKTKKKNTTVDIAI
eukprot:g6992.t1